MTSNPFNGRASVLAHILIGFLSFVVTALFIACFSSSSCSGLILFLISIPFLAIDGAESLIYFDIYLVIFFIVFLSAAALLVNLIFMKSAKHRAFFIVVSYLLFAASFVVVSG